MRNDGVSVIICCFNSEKVIAKTLKHIFRQEVDNVTDWEVILVDNGSTDNTVEVAEIISKDSDAPFKIINQPVPGKTNALKKGFDTARYEFILICDDDNFLQKNYLQRAYNIMVDNPQVGCLGGHGYEQTDGHFPSWFQNYKNYYACGRQSESGNDITVEKKYVYGAGSVIRKSIFEELDDEIFLKKLPGRKDGNMVGGEDNLMGYIAVIAGYRIWYSDHLKFIHKINEDRLKWNYLTNVCYSVGRVEIYLQPFTNFIRHNKKPKSFLKKIIKNSKHIASIIKNNGFGLFKEREGSRQILLFYYYLGKIKELLKLNFFYKKEYRKSIRYCEFIERKKRLCPKKWRSK